MKDDLTEIDRKIDRTRFTREVHVPNSRSPT